MLKVLFNVRIGLLNDGDCLFNVEALEYWNME